MYWSTPQAQRADQGVGLLQLAVWLCSKALTKHVQPLVERRRVIPERRMSHMGHHVHLRVGHQRLMLLDSGRFNDRVRDSMRNQYWFADLWQQVIITERTREQSLTHIGRDKNVVFQHQRLLGCRQFLRITQTQEAF